MFENLYTTKMSGGAKILQRRFAKIRSHGSGKVMSVIMSAVLVCITATATVAMAALENDSIKYEVYNGETRIQLRHEPFIYDGEYYLPLRDILNGFGITDISYDNGKINIEFPESDSIKSAELTIGDGVISTVHTDYEGGTALSAVPILKDETTYVTEGTFEFLMTCSSQLADFSINIIRPTEPECYYESGENVFIGTAAEQDLYTAEHPNETVKRIIVDEDNKVIAVVPIENQRTDNITEKLSHSKVQCAIWANGYYALFYQLSVESEDANGNTFSSSLPGMIYSSGESTSVYEYTVPASAYAYVTPADIIQFPENGTRKIITNTYGE